MSPARQLRAVLMACAGLGLVATLPAMALAQQVIERNPPPAPPTRPPSITIGSTVPGSTDETPLGVDLSGIALVGAGEQAAGRAGPGITIGAIDGAPDQALRAALAPYLSQPLSLALISRIQAEVIQVWRDSGYPFVSVTVPPQEITTGVLKLRVVEFRAGTKTVKGVDGPAAGRIAAGVRVSKGDRIVAAQLNEDLRWLERTGYRNVAAVFAPGSEFGISDLTLDVTSARNPGFYAGWSNTGSRTTDRNRIFVGFSAWIPQLNDAGISYQLTGSPNLWSHPDRIAPSTGDYPDYLSHSARITIPTFARQAIEITPDVVATREDSTALLAIENTTWELPVVYRSALSNLVPGLYAGDIYGGVEFKWLERSTFFNNTKIADGDAGVFQLVAGWAHGFDDRLGRTDFDLSVVANPGGVVGGNSDSRWSTFSNGRVTDVNYVYGTASIVRYTRLPRNFAWISQFSGQITGQPLPDSERIGLGGYYAVRGYDVDDATVDSGLVWRNDLRLPSLSIFANSALAVPDALSPYLFADLGYGRDEATHESETLASLGAGLDYAIGNTLSASLIAGIALSDAIYTRSGDVRVQASITARY